MFVWYVSKAHDRLIGYRMMHSTVGKDANLAADSGADSGFDSQVGYIFASHGTNFPLDIFAHFFFLSFENKTILIF